MMKKNPSAPSTSTRPRGASPPTNHNEFESHVELCVFNCILKSLSLYLSLVCESNKRASERERELEKKKVNNSRTMQVDAFKCRLRTRPKSGRGAPPPN